MTAHVPRLPLSIDPLIREAKRRARQRRVLATVLLGVALAAASTVLVLRWPGGPVGTRPVSTGGASTHSAGHVVGSVQVVGGPAGYSLHGWGGLVTVYNPRGQIVERIRVQRGRNFDLRLAPGRYRLGYGRHPRSLWGCRRPTVATVTGGRTTHQNLVIGCDWD